MRSSVPAQRPSLERTIPRAGLAARQAVDAVLSCPYGEDCAACVRRPSCAQGLNCSRRTCRVGAPAQNVLRWGCCPSAIGFRHSSCRQCCGCVTTPMVQALKVVFIKW